MCGCVCACVCMRVRVRVFTSQTFNSKILIVVHVQQAYASSQCPHVCLSMCECHREITSVGLQSLENLLNRMMFQSIDRHQSWVLARAAGEQDIARECASGPVFYTVYIYEKRTLSTPNDRRFHASVHPPTRCFLLKTEITEASSNHGNRG